MATGTRTGVKQLKYFNPYETVSAATMSTMGGIDTVPADEITKQYGSGTMKVSGIDDGDWILVSGVDFGADGAALFGGTFSVNGDAKGAVTVRLDSLTDGKDAVTLPIGDSAGASRLGVGISISEKITGVHDVYFLFSGSGYEWISWKFGK